MELKLQAISGRLRAGSQPSTGGPAEAPSRGAQGAPEDEEELDDDAFEARMRRQVLQRQEQQLGRGGPTGGGSSSRTPRPSGGRGAGVGAGAAVGRVGDDSDDEGDEAPPHGGQERQSRLRLRKGIKLAPADPALASKDPGRQGAARSASSVSRQQQVLCFLARLRMRGPRHAAASFLSGHRLVRCKL